MMQCTNLDKEGSGAMAEGEALVSASNECSEASIEVFRWGGRECSGSKIHKAVLAQDLDLVSSIIAENPQAVSERFTYETAWAGKKQEGSGEPLHLAASRNLLKVVKRLVRHGAKCDAVVTRDLKPHYDVLHAAVWSEGYGGSEEMVTYLLSARAEMTRNMDGHTVLHKAFQTGKIPLIHLIRREMQARHPAEALATEEEVDGHLATPLQLGIRQGRLSEEQLSQLALGTAVSLHIFIVEEPRVIPFFLARVKEESSLSARELSHKIDIKDVAKLLRDYPIECCAILDSLTDVPECEAVGFHPLPTRLSFRPRGLHQHVRELCNPNGCELAFFSEDNSWKYNLKEFQHPEWHSRLLDRVKGGSIKDVSITVCHLKGIACPEFLNALILGTKEEQVYDHHVIRGVLHAVWWNGAWRQDIMQFFLTAFGLALLMIDSFIGCAGEGSSGSRRLAHLGGMSVEDDLFKIQPLSTSSSCEGRVAGQFLAMKGVADLLQEVLQFAGLCKINSARDYCTPGNVLDLARGILAIIFGFTESHRLLQSVVILLYWARLLDISFSELLQRELLPIIRLGKGLTPSAVVALIAFCGLTHALLTVDEGLKPWPDGIHKSFTMLITAGLPEIHDNIINLVFSYFAVLIFTVFFLNIFIGVIGENYGMEKERAHQSFQELRAGHCLAWHLRASVMPAPIVSGSLARVIRMLSVTQLFVVEALLMLQVLQPSWMSAVFLLVPLLPLTAGLHVCSNCESGTHAPSAYIWTIMPGEVEPPSQLDRIESKMDEILERMAALEQSAE